MNALAIEAEVDSQGWLSIHAPAPPGAAPNKGSASSLSRNGHSSACRPLPGKVELAAVLHAPLEDFKPYAE